MEITWGGSELPIEQFACAQSMQFLLVETFGILNAFDINNQSKLKDLLLYFSQKKTA